MNQSVHDFSAFAILITRLEDFILQLCDDGRDEGRLGVGKEGDGGDQGSTVEVDHVLMWVMMKNVDGDYEKMKGRLKGRNLITSRSLVIVIMKEMKLVVHHKFALYTVHCTPKPRDASYITWVKKKKKRRPCFVFSSVFARHTSDLHLSVSQRFKVWSDWSQIKHRTFIFLVCFCVLCCVDRLESAWLCSTQCVNDNPPSLADDRATLPSGDAAREKTIRCVPCVTRLSQTELSPL